jgi:hypothetical protein
VILVLLLVLSLVPLQFFHVFREWWWVGEGPLVKRVLRCNICAYRVAVGVGSNAKKL